VLLTKKRAVAIIIRGLIELQSNFIAAATISLAINAMPSMDAKSQKYGHGIDFQKKRFYAALAG